jgi:chitin synthase
MNPDKLSAYRPDLSREFSGYSQGSDPEVNMSSDAQAFITSNTTVKRAKSLVRPERERINENHRQYHYRQAASNNPDTVQPSTTGNLPQRGASRRATTREAYLRRGRSLLGREEKAAGSEASFEYTPEERKSKWKSKLPGPWMTYCYLITCCIPPFALRWSGNIKSIYIFFFFFFFFFF